MTKRIFHLVFFAVPLSFIFGQSPVRKFDSSQYDSEFYLQFAPKKKFPKEIASQVLTALSFYPELSNVKIIFRIKKRKTPLTSRPRILSVFRRKKNRCYVITISSETTEQLSPILFDRLPYNAQIGVLGHELGHITEYNSKNTFQIIGLSFSILNSKFVDKFEWNTDKIAIDHGLGYQLLDWSSYVRNTLNILEWKGATKDLANGNELQVNQRYMNPITIIRYIKERSIYKPLLD